MTSYETEVHAAAAAAKAGNARESDSHLWAAVHAYAAERHVNLPSAVQYVTELGAELFFQDGVRA